MTPKVVHNVKENLSKAHQKGKKSYDRTARLHEKVLQPGQTVRIQTEKGFDRLAYIKRPADGPRSFVVVQNGKEYVRNQRHLLPVNEQKPISKRLDPEPTARENQEDPPPQSQASESPPINHQPSPKKQQAPHNADCQVTTRSGRKTKLPTKYDNFIVKRA